MKNFIKYKWPNFFNTVKYLKKMKDDFILENIFNTSYAKHALLSYIKTPFLNKNQHTHTNYIEAKTWAEILNEFGYTVDVVEYDSPKIYPLEKYDLLCGFGNTFDNSLEYKTKKTLKRILYSTGFNHVQLNYISLKRTKEVFEKKGVWLINSARYVKNAWPTQIHLSDAIISIGNQEAVNSYDKNLSKITFMLPSPISVFHDFNKILKYKSKNTRKNFLWFGSSGFIHKGLDLLLEFFSSRNDLTLHLCGMIGEESFQKTYKDELSANNIINHGFIHINSQVFERILKECSYVIFPSVSEGGSPAVLTTIANGALYPIVTINTSFEIPNKTIIDEINLEGISEAIKNAEKINDVDFNKLSTENAEFALKFHNKENYKKVLKEAIIKILN
jgi:hypothetical protein